MSETSPTFWAKAVYGKVLKMPPSTVPRPSARSPSARLLRVTGLSTISPTAIMSPVVSVMMTMPTMIIETIAATFQVGRPKWNGVMRANHPASPTPSQCTIPGMSRATSVPTTRPSSTDTRCSAGGAKRSISTMKSRVPAAKATLIGSAPSGLPSTIHPAATRMSDRPMMRITVPVTIGGKNRSSCEKNGATRIMKRPHAIVAPKMSVMPPPSGDVPIAIIGPTAAKVTPCMSGRRTPNRQKPIDWTIVAMPATNRSALMRNAMSAELSPIALPTMSGTATAPAYIARTCCSPSGNSRASGGIESTVFSVARLFLSFFPTTGVDAVVVMSVLLSVQCAEGARTPS